MTQLATRAVFVPLELLVLSNVFMIVAWYGHLKFRGLPMWTAVLASWGIAWRYLGERLRWNEMAAFGLIFVAVIVASLPGGR